MQLALGWLIVLSGSCATAGAMRPEGPPDGIEWGRESLGARSDLPWYDASEDRLRRIDVAPNQDDENRHSQWAADEQAATAAPRPRRDWSLLWKILETLAWLTLGSLLALLIWALVRAALWSDLRAVRGEVVVEQVQVSESRIEDLPVPVSPQHHDLLSAARAYYAAGDYTKAIIHAFAHQLVELDKHHLIQLSKGKTNRQYLAELSRHPVFKELFRPTMLACEDVFFGHHALSRQRFQACWDDLDRFHQQLEQVAP